MLLPRVLTAIIGVPLLLFMIHWGGLAFSLFICAMCALCAREYALILRLGSRPVQAAAVVASAAALSLGLALGAPLGLVLSATVIVTVLLEMASRAPSLERAALTVFGSAFLGLLPAHLTLLRGLRPSGEKLCFLLFLCVWVMDTAAYAAGKSFGRRALAPMLSPRKTWEGAAAGFAAAVACAMAGWAAFLRPDLTHRQALGLAALIGVSGQLSDLAESMVKRAVGAKDSGTLLPGHGGVMDRFDSFFLCAPIVYYYLELLR